MFLRSQVSVPDIIFSKVFGIIFCLLDHIPSSVWKHCVLDDLAAYRLLAVRHVFDSVHTNFACCTEPGTTHWCCYFPPGRMSAGSDSIC